MEYFSYGKKEIRHLTKRDSALGVAIKRIGMIRRETTEDPFQALISSIVAQQISSKAAHTVWGRLMTRLGEITPEKLLEVGTGAIQECGMSHRKAEYIHGIAVAAEAKQVDFTQLPLLDDQQVIRQLSSIKGVGVWTAEMLLIFSLRRPDIVSFGDLGIHRGMQRLYGEEKISKEAFRALKERYSPHGTVASLYLWAIAAEPE